MKKKLIKSLLFLIALSFFVVNVDAASYLNIPFKSVTSKAPTIIPNAGTTVYATTTEGFDFSEVIFKDSQGNDLHGKSDLEKIIIGNVNSSYNVSLTGTHSLDDMFTYWFTAYCLDGTKKYPQYSVLRHENFNTHNTNNEYSDAVHDLIDIAVANSSSFDVYNQRLATKMASGNYIGFHTVYTYVATPTEKTDQQIMEDFNAGTTVTLNITGFGFKPFTLNGSTVVYDDNNIVDGPDGDGTSITITLSLSDYAFQKYITSDNTNISNYDHALWIVEHSYPTLSLEKTLEMADGFKGMSASYSNLLSNVRQTHNDLSEEEAKKIVEGYVYGTVQYAIWKSTGYTVNGKILGNSIVNYTDLNTLYQYLIEDRPEYRNYSNPGTYTNEITISKPKEGKELFKKTDNSYYYGPFQASYNALVFDNNKMSVTITNEDTTGLKVVDANGHELTEVAIGEEFYIEVNKNAKVGSISARLTLDGVQSFSPSTNRGRVYNPVYALGQNALSGGKTTNITVTGDFSFAVVVKTGVENIALLLMVTLVAFTLGYLVLSYKQNPVQLQQ